MKRIRIRILIYDADRADSMTAQIANSVHGTRLLRHRHLDRVTVQAIDIHAAHITLSEIWSLLKLVAWPWRDYGRNS